MQLIQVLSVSLIPEVPYDSLIVKYHGIIKCWTRLMRIDLVRFTKHAELWQYFAPDVVYVVWI